VGDVVPGSSDKEDRRRWLEELAAACERVLIRDAEPTTDRYHAALRQDVAALLAQIRTELDALGG
jgi:hypothetical protein